MAVKPAGKVLVGISQSRSRLPVLVMVSVLVVFSPRITPSNAILPDSPMTRAALVPVRLMVSVPAVLSLVTVSVGA